MDYPRADAWHPLRGPQAGVVNGTVSIVGGNDSSSGLIRQIPAAHRAGDRRGNRIQKLDRRLVPGRSRRPAGTG